MALKIIEKKEQPMLSRIEIKGTLEFEGATPSAEEVKKQLSSELKVDEKLIAVKNIFTSFGVGKADLIAYAYLNKEDMERIEPKEKGKKAKPGAPKGGAAEAPKEVKEAPKEAPKAKEETKEAPKEEKPKGAKEEKPKE